MKSGKGQTKEMFEVLVVIVVLVVLFLFLSLSNIQRESAEKELLEKKEMKMKVENAIISFKSSKIYGTERPLAAILSDAIASKNLTVDYGEGYGALNTTKLITDFFNAYFDKKWQFVVHVPIEEKDVALILDTSRSLKDEVSIIKSKINETYETGLKKHVRLKIFTLKGPGTMYTCDIFRGTDVEKECSFLEGCNLLPQIEEDWGNAIKCVIEKYNVSAVIVLTDEVSTGSEPAVCTNGKDMGNFPQSYNTGLQSCESKGVPVFTIKANITVDDCLNNFATWCSFYYHTQPVLTPSICQMYAIDLLIKSLQDISNECYGKYFDLEKVRPDDAVAEIIKIIPPPPDIIFGYKIPQDVTDIHSFVLEIPYVSYKGEKVTGELKVW